MKRIGILLAALALELALFTSISGHTFHSAREFFRYEASYFADLIPQAAPILLLGFGMTVVLITAGIDLSVGSTVALISCVMASMPAGANFWAIALPAGLAVACAAGLLNGTLIAALDVPPIIATLGTMIFFRGLCYVIMGDLEKSPFLDAPGYESLGRFAGAALLVLIVFGAGGLFFSKSRWRRELLMLGGNRVAARFAAIPVERRTFQVYLLMGALAFFAALIFTARNGSVSASSLTGLELQVIVAVVLGGTRAQGGSGTLVGTFFGVLFVAVLDEGLRGAALWGTRTLPFKTSHLQHVLLGLLLMTGVGLGNWLNRTAAEPGTRSP